MDETNNLSTAPVLSTPAEHLFEHVQPEVPPAENEAQSHKRSDHELRDVYEIARTAKEIRAAKRRRIALQFPDSMLGDAPWVVGALRQELDIQSKSVVEDSNSGRDEHEKLASPLSTQDEQQVTSSEGAETTTRITPSSTQSERIYILGDTSYSACCVDEVAAEHADADVVVHYGRTCLSPTSRLSVIYVFTKHLLDLNAVLASFEGTFQDKLSRIILMADVTYQDHISGLAAKLADRGYTNLLATSIIHNPLGRIPNRAIHSPSAITAQDMSEEIDLAAYSVFHISTPPTALLLALASRVKELHIYPTDKSASGTSATMASRLLSRRYARVLSLASAGVIGILVNTLSVANFLPAVDRVRSHIAAAGKKSYTVVVGKVNPAKLANFAEVEGWVVVSCWESSLVEEEAAAVAAGGYYRPVVTPFELDVALMGDDRRVWSGDWWGGIERLDAAEADPVEPPDVGSQDDEGQDVTDDDESAPPEFDLRTGKLISTSRPMKVKKLKPAQQADQSTESGALTLRPKAELATVNGVVSPGADFLRSQRTWQGLGTDFDTSERSTAIEEGRSGIARGYTVGENHERT
jgi:diphthamide biosynthesis protein 2